MREKIFKMLKETGLEVVYRTWDEGADTQLPYIAYRLVDTDNMHADNQVYCPITNWAVEFYSKRKDDEAESKIEAVLNKNKIGFNKQESQIEKDLMMVLYLFQRIGE